VRSGPGAARTILLFHFISARPSKQPRMVRTFLKVYMKLVFYFLFLQEQIKDIIIIREFVGVMLHEFYKNTRFLCIDSMNVSVTVFPRNAGENQGGL